MSDHGSMELASLTSACSAEVECIQGGGTFAYALEDGFTDFLGGWRILACTSPRRRAELKHNAHLIGGKRS